MNDFVWTVEAVSSNLAACSIVPNLESLNGNSVVPNIPNRAGWVVIAIQ